MKKEFDIEVKDLTIKAVFWEEEEYKKPTAVVVIVHGMAEHINRYNDFAKFLNSNGLLVYGYDQRGHGLTAKNVEEIGFMNSVDSFSVLVDDLEIVLNHVKNKQRDLPVILFGHSMGSFVSQYLLIKKDIQLDGVILSGSNGNPGIAINPAIFLAKTINQFKGPKYRSKLMDHLVFGNFNRKYRVPKKFFNWLSRDSNVVQAYYDDELCGAIFTISFFRDFLTGLKRISKEYHYINPNVPIFIFSGDDDPVGKYGKGVFRLYNDLKDAGIKDIQIKLYPEGRHEMLNEINKGEVYFDILNWLSKYI